MNALVRLRQALERVQAEEKHHKRIGVAVGGHREPPPMGKVCSRCPSKQLCGDLSLALAAAETDAFSS